MLREVFHTSVALMAGIWILAVPEEGASASTGKAGQRPDQASSMMGTAMGSDVELAYGAVGQSDSQGGEMDEHSGTSAPHSGWTVYADPTYGFSIHYPNGFKVRSQDVKRLAQFTPTPVASIFFMNPTMAAGDLAGIEPPDLEVRIYEVGAVDSLSKWLVSVGFASVDSIASAQPFVGHSFSGLKVCRSTMIAPGCSIYLLHRGFVVQLTPMSVEGETMAETFSPSSTLLPREP
jgi:hypothetical protein